MNPLRERGLFLFPWDLKDEGLDKVMRFSAESGITTLYMASVYHAGFFLQPHNPIRKVYLLEDGVAYFHPEMRYYGSIKPQVAEVSREIDWFEAASRRLHEFGLKLSAWTVCMHNSRIGQIRPDVVVRDAFCNPHPFALCPSHPDVRQYIRSLLKDLLRYPLGSLFSRGVSVPRCRPRTSPRALEHTASPTRKILARDEFHSHRFGSSETVRCRWRGDTSQDNGILESLLLPLPVLTQ